MKNIAADTESRHSRCYLINKAQLSIIVLVYALQACLSWSFESLFVDLHISTTCTSWSSLDTGVVDMLHGPISFCHNSKIYLDVLVISYNRIAWGLGGGC